MGINKKDRDGKKGRSKSLSIEQIKNLIQLWGDHSVDELASKFMVSRGTIEKVAREVRKQNTELCPKKANDLANKVAQALCQLVRETQTEKNFDNPLGNDSKDSKVVSLSKK